HNVGYSFRRQPHDGDRRRNGADRNALVRDPCQPRGWVARTVQPGAVSVDPGPPASGDISGRCVGPGHRADTTWGPWRLMSPCVTRSVQTGPVKEEPRASASGDQLRTLARARASTDREDWEHAAGLWGEVVAANPVDGSHWFELAQARSRRKDLDGA